jgi:hypothetical protein
MRFMIVLVLVAILGASADDFFTIDVLNANTLQVGNHSYHPPEDATLAEHYKEISVVVGVEKDAIGCYLAMPQPTGKESIHTAVPFYSITLRTKDGTEITTKHQLEVPLATRVSGFRGLLPLSKVPAHLKIEVVIHHPREATFNFVLENILSVKDGTYDLKPANTSMGTYFVISIANNSVTWYLKRKPPIPPFVFTLFDGNNDEVVNQVVNRVNADGIGFRNVINLKDGGINLDLLVFRVQFRERFRSKIAFASLKQPQALIDKLKANPSQPEIIKPDMEHEVLFQLQYFNSTKYIAVMIVQVDGPRHPIGHLQLHVSQRNTKTGASSIVFLEEERQVPVLLPHVTPQFGWYHVLRTETRKKSNASTTKEDGEESDDTDEGKTEPYVLPPDTVLDIEAFYDFRATASSEELFIEWLADYDTDLRNFTVHRSHRQRRGCTATNALKYRQIVGSMPYRLLLTQHVVTKYEWWSTINESEAWSSHVEKFDIGNGLTVAAAMTFFSLMKANSPYDGMNWRLYFDNILEDRLLHHQPSFWNKPELELLEFSYAAKEAKEHLDIMVSEYEAMCAAIKWFEQTIKKEEYITMRTHIAARLLNISGVILAAPFVDYLHHDDAPNIVLRFDDKRRKMDFIAAHDTMQGTVLSMNYGTESKTKQDFLLQYGWVPVGARDAVMVKDTILTAEKNSRSSIVRKLTEEAGSVLGGLQAFTKLLSEKVVSMPTHIEASNRDASLPKVDPHRVALMERILESERYVIHRHLAWVEEDIASMSL